MPSPVIFLRLDAIIFMSARRVKKHEDTRYLTKRATQSFSDGKTRVLVVDDHPVVWHGINLLLNRQDDLTCCQDKVDSVAGIIPAVKRDHPQMLLLDLNLKDGNSLGIIGTLRDQFPDVPVLVISQFDNIRCAEDALHAGAVGYVMKEEAAQEILTAIRTVLRNETYISHKLLNLAASGPVPAPTSQRPAIAEHLAEGELQVFLLLGSGMPLSDVATQLKISVETLETWCKNLKDKLKLPDDTALTNLAMKCKSCFETNGIDSDAALFHCAVQLERCEWGKPPQSKPAQPEPPSGFPDNPR
jgi:DNA-binding NarL/FixJ family response regulator